MGGIMHMGSLFNYWGVVEEVIISLHVMLINVRVLLLLLLAGEKKIARLSSVTVLIGLGSR